MISHFSHRKIQSSHILGPPCSSIPVILTLPPTTCQFCSSFSCLSAGPSSLQVKALSQISHGPLSYLLRCSQSSHLVLLIIQFQVATFFPTPISMLPILLTLSFIFFLYIYAYFKIYLFVNDHLPALKYKPHQRQLLLF